MITTVKLPDMTMPVYRECKKGVYGDFTVWWDELALQGAPDKLRALARYILDSVEPSDAERDQEAQREAA